VTRASATARAAPPRRMSVQSRHFKQMGEGMLAKVSFTAGGCK
jgi:hypothetical protein